jgi:hypothetical protein
MFLIPELPLKHTKIIKPARKKKNVGNKYTVKFDIPEPRYNGPIRYIGIGLS